jgi:sialate O-acetylesterase
MKKLIIMAAVLALLATAAGAAVLPAALFSDNAVLQQGIAAPVWGAADSGEKVTVKFQDQEVSTVAKDGKWMVRLAPLKAGGPYKMSITGSNTIELSNILVGEVWVCSGQSNMQFGLESAANGPEAVAAATSPTIRLFSVPLKTSYTPVADAKASWQLCSPEAAKKFTAVGYFFGRDLNKTLSVPVGLINSSWGGTFAEAWTSPDGFKSLPGYAPWIADENAKKPDGPNHPSVLYNAMINPLIPYAIKGAIWYQGESNAGAAFKYRTLFPTMIKSWRDAWGQGNFTFLFVQLAPFQAIKTEPQESAWAELREAQLLTTKTCPKTGMAVITDVGSPTNIHPTQKEPVGARLALAARKIAYGQDIVFSGPIYKGMKRGGGSITLYFDNVGGGLVAKDGELTGFAIAGSDSKFVNATAKIVDGNKVIVNSPSVGSPVAVRYAWADCPVVNLFNKEDLPASPFRTDDFAMVTAPKK